MKPVSIIFMIVAAFLIIAGLLVCSVGMIQAKNQGINLYDEAIGDDGTVESSVDFSTEEVNKIQIDVGKCDVEIICNSDSDRVVINNISTAGYICEVQNKALVFEDSLNIFSLTDLAQGNFRFKGFRYYLHNRNIAETGQKVTVYLSSKYDIKMVEVKIKEGNFSISGYEQNTDYSISVTKGNITTSDLTTDSGFTASVGSGNIKLTNIKCPKITLSEENGNINALISSSEVTVNSTKGNVTIETEDDLELFNYDVKAPLGYVTINGVTKAKKHVATDAMLTKFFNIDCKNGDVVLKTYINGVGTDTSEPDTGTGSSEDTTVPVETDAAA